jgi:hypothetical protein
MVRLDKPLHYQSATTPYAWSGSGESNSAFVSLEGCCVPLTLVNPHDWFGGRYGLLSPLFLFLCATRGYFHPQHRILCRCDLRGTRHQHLVAGFKPPETILYASPKEYVNPEKYSVQDHEV